MTLIFAWSAPSACVQQLQLEFRVNNSTFCCAERSVISNLQLCIYAIAPVGALPCSSDTQCSTAQHVNCVLADCSLISSLIVLFSLIYHHDDASYWTHEIKSNLLINWDFLPFLWSRSKAQVFEFAAMKFLASNEWWPYLKYLVGTWRKLQFSWWMLLSSLAAGRFKFEDMISVDDLL